MDYMREYEKWLASPALTPEEHAELESIRGDEKEIRERFYGPLEFGTAGLRGTMKVGLHQMNIHVIRWATQGFADVIAAEGEEGKRRGVAICMDCRNHSMEFARAAACVMEGSIILMVDNSAAVMILPTSFFDFTQEANDFYFPPLVGTYLRVLRVTVFLISLLITPAWYLMVSSPGRLPSWLDFLSSPEPAALSLLSQLLVVEFLIDVLKLASLNTPDTLSNSFSMLGALILGDFAVQAGWLGPEVLVYMAFVSVAGFAQPSYELGYAFKLLRVALLLLTAAFDVWGFCLGFVGILVLLATTKPLVGHGYLYPLIPFNGKALRRLLVREPINRDNT